MDENYEYWTSLIRSYVAAFRVPPTPEDIDSEIITIEGKQVPFQKFNYGTLEKMLGQINGLKLYKKNGRTFVRLVPMSEPSCAPIAPIDNETQEFNWQSDKPTWFRWRPVWKRLDTPPNPDLVQPPNNSNDNANTCSTASDSIVPSTSKKLTPLAKQSETTVKKTKKRNRQARKLKKQLSQQLSQNIIEVANQSVIKVDYLPNPYFKHGLTAQEIQHFIALWSNKDPRLKLLGYTNMRKVSAPVYKPFTLKNNSSFYCSIHVDSTTFNTYPSAAKSEEEAKQIAAKVALERLIGLGQD